MKIGFFDSGIGGISVLHKAMKALPDEEFIYYADTEHVPYGRRSREEIRKYAQEAVRFMIEQGAAAIVIACNTATSAAIEFLREHYTLPILGMEPAVKPAVQMSNGRRVLVTATPFTIREERLQHLVATVDDHHLVDMLPLGELVVFAERGEFDSEAVREYLRKELAGRDLSLYGTMVLGCTHFGYFRPVLHEILGKDVRLVEGSEGTIHHLVDLLTSKNLLTHAGSGVTYYRSGVEVTDPDTLYFYNKLHKQLDEMEI